MKNNRLHYLEDVVKYVSNRTNVFGVCDVRLAAECKQKEMPSSASDWSRLLRGCVAKGLIEPTEAFYRARLKESNGIGRRLYRKKGDSK